MKGAAAKSVPNRLAALTLGAWSVLLLYFYFGGRLRTFLAPDFRPYVLWAGVAMGVMALALFFAGGKLHACTDDGCGHTGGRGRQWTFLVLLLPVLIAFCTGETDTFSATMVTNRGVTTEASELRSRPRPTRRHASVLLPVPAREGGPPPGQEVPDTGTPPPPRSRESALFPLPTRDGTPPEPNELETTSSLDWMPRTAEGHLRIEVLDLIFAAQDAALRGDLEGKTAELTGQFMLAKSRNPKGNRFKCVRMMMACCAADARPVAVLVECNKLPKVPEMKWVRITGTVTFPLEAGKRVPVLRAQKVEPCAPPDERFIF